ncbi:MAG: type III pantothenate kinase [Chloroflexota bacterium]|nr:type III pantothenate kinase [Chloroflexota bacterium]
MSGLLLAIDIGNTNIKLGTFLDDKITATWRVATDVLRMPDEYAVLLDWLLARRGLTFADIAGVSLSSTVPAMVPMVKELVGNYLSADCPLIEVRASGNTGVTITIENPSEMGADRIVDALAAAELYRLPAIIVDFGTATTFDAVDRDGHLLGTALAPGLRTAMDGLFQRAARLSRIELGKPKQVIGRNTVDALRSGWVYGYVGLVEGLVTRIKASLGDDALVLATGGLADYVLAETSIVDVHDPILTLKGLRLYYERNIPCPKS